MRNRAVYLATKNNEELTEVFGLSEIPEINELNGEYRVDMLTGPIPNMRGIGHRKIFAGTNGAVRGCNIVFSKARWGDFFLEKAACSDPGELPALLINYDVPENGCVTKRIRDQVRRLDEYGHYLGRFYMTLFGKPRFLAYFMLTKA